MLQSSKISAVVMKVAAEAGFDLAGIAAVEDAPELEYFPRWIAEGRAGEMKYLEARDDQGQLKRASLAHAAPWARSVVVCAINYNTAPPYSTQVPDHCELAPGDPNRSESVQGRGWISRYAWGRQDYHVSVMRRLRHVEAALRKSCGAHDQGKNDTDRDTELDKDENKANDLITRCYVDTGPIVERVVAKYAGIGWIGKNTCIINQKLGSWLFLGVILTSIDVKPESAAANLAAPDRCGSCTRCIDACPTDALTAPYRLDSNKCISYLTIEKRGAIPADNDLRLGMGRHIFGCDICQDVCPWNRKAPATNAAEFQPRGELINPPLDWLAEMSEEEFRGTFRGSPVRRAKRSGLRRNAMIAMGNSGERKFIPLLERLTADDDEAVRDGAAWALSRLG